MAGVPDAVARAAVHGSYCPKLCTFACPVVQATGREDAVPWGFHRTLVDLVEGRIGGAAAASRLVACTGCLACRVPCTFEQDVPDQVRAGRAVARPVTPAADEVLQHLAAGWRPDGTAPPTGQPVAAADLVLAVGCSDDPGTAAAAERLFSAAGLQVDVVTLPGCCGQLADDLGAPDVAAGRRGATAELLADRAATVVALDPHCMPTLRQVLSDRRVVDVATALAEHLERLPLGGEPLPVTFHDPCVLARGAGVVDPPRALLAAAGLEVVEPEGSREWTRCSGAGLGLPLLDPDAAAATAAQRRDQLAAAAPMAVTVCSRSRRQLCDAGGEVTELVVLLATRLMEEGA